MNKTHAVTLAALAAALALPACSGNKDAANATVDNAAIGSNDVALTDEGAIATDNLATDNFTATDAPLANETAPLNESTTNLQ